MSVFLVGVLRLLGCLENVLQGLFARHTLLGLLFLELAGVAIGPTSLRLRLDLLFFLEEAGIDFENMFIKVIGLQALNCDIKVRLHHRSDITLTHAEMESLNIVVMAEESVDFGFNQNVGDYCCQMICCDLLIFKERVRLSNDLNHFMELL